MSVIDGIKSIFAPSQSKCVVTLSHFVGLFEGGSVGEALGMPVKDRTAEQLHRSPVTDMLGFGDYQTPGGTLSVCSSSSCGFATFMSDNEVQGFAPQRFLALCNSWYLYKVKDEEAPLRLLLPAAVVAGCLFSALPRINVRDALPSMPDLVCDSCISSASLFFGVSKYISAGFSPKEAVKKASDLSSKICSEIGLVVNHTGITTSFKNILNSCFDSAEGGFSAMVLGAVNSGVFPDLSGYLVGALAGLSCASDGIPSAWKSSVSGIDAVRRSGEIVNTLISHALANKV
ncbi:MAG: hypothetical protein J5882_04720 [Bacteroidales bacterium]|nr:hypothetical protein [Bacteroidales bacterium]